MPVVAFCGRQFDRAELRLICAVVKGCAGLSPMELARTVRELLHSPGVEPLRLIECEQLNDAGARILASGIETLIGVLRTLRDEIPDDDGESVH